MPERAWIAAAAPMDQGARLGELSDGGLDLGSGVGDEGRQQKAALDDVEGKGEGDPSRIAVHWEGSGGLEHHLRAP
jgi:hypothetical protein